MLNGRPGVVGAHAHRRGSVANLGARRLGSRLERGDGIGVALGGVLVCRIASVLHRWRVLIGIRHGLLRDFHRL